MKQKYESPELDVYIFDVRDAIMNTGCPTLDIGCPGDGVCIVEFPCDLFEVPSGL